MSILVSLCLLKIEIVRDMSTEAESSTQEEAASSQQTNPRFVKDLRGQREPKKIQIETYANVVSFDEIEVSEKGVLPKSSREQTPLEDSAAIPEVPGEINFFSGNPFVEQTTGILHLYKNNELNSIQDGLSKTICLLAVPSTLNCHDILSFIAPCHPEITHVRIIRDGTPNQFMVILEFRAVESAYEFYKTYNGAPYNSFEPDQVCHALWVSAIAWGNDGTPPQNHTELPTCPVCLERMDESVDGVLTILCNHTFHSGCLVKWGDSTCPICRYVQTPELTESSVCMECEGTETLWICLICGHVGCGRYQGGHAANHHRSTNHTYALQIGTNRVWDYAGDNFVHRLLQNKTDGKLVATNSPGNEDEEKIDSMQLEFTYLLTSQLDTQRQHYEERLSRIEAAMAVDKKSILKETEKIRHDSAQIEQKLNGVIKEKQNLEKKLAAMNTRLTTVLKELAEEKQFSKTLQLNHTSWQTKYGTLEKLCKEKEQEVIELKEQVRDLMFYMEAQNTISNSDMKDEIAEGTVTMGDESSSNKSKNRRKKK
ncbi:CLUMA_CG004592, isoform A [Clunio marinus]|uniref:CLUMA_CG004592, isoform A n=1 Tax=Clunio marinus TaxID=568069 RepID=A0A1J1HS73_9DIPT|nr:CLUMA_CG004592, isoform A [Clunio marinus]